MSPDASPDPRTLIDPQLAAALKKVAEINAALGPPGPGVVGMREHAARGREWWNEGGPVLAEAREASIPGPMRDIPVMVYRPTLDRKLPVFVYLHGGGYKIGSHKANDRQMRELAAQWGGAIVSTDYAHMPEYVFPTAVEEAAAVYRWVNGHGAEWGIDGSRIVFGGSSAGANVAFGAAVHLGGVKTGFLKAGVGIVGVFDRDTETESMRLFGTGALYPDRKGIAATAEEYVPSQVQRSDPRVNLPTADPLLFPPVYFAAAELDCLRDSSRNMATRLAAAGRPHRLKVYPGMTHLFFGFSRMVDRSAECGRDIAEFLKQHVPAS